MYLPPYSPDLNPIEGAFAKLKGRLRATAARGREALIRAMGAALEAISADAMPAASSATVATARRTNPYDRCFNPKGLEDRKHYRRCRIRPFV